MEHAGEAMKIAEIEIAEPGVGQVRVRVKHCGCCHSDLSIANASFPAPMPIVLGHEAAGVVEQVGPGVANLSVGDHVVLTPCPPCGHCYWCVRGESSSCVNSSAIATNQFPDGSTGLSRDGQVVYRGLGVAAFAEEVIMSESGAVRIPADVPLDVACVVGCAVQTGVGAVLNTARVEEGSSVLVMGLGGVGLAAVEGARLAGASRRIVSDPVAERREAAAHFGATDLIDPGTQDLAQCVQEITRVGVDYAFETAGRAELVAVGVAATRNRGTTVCVGAPPIDQSIQIAPAALLVIQEKKILGSLLGSSNSLHEIPRLIGLYQAGLLDLDSLITSRRPLTEIDAAMADLEANRGIRTVLTI